jgi:hypothetical protein
LNQETKIGGFRITLPQEIDMQNNYITLMVRKSKDVLINTINFQLWGSTMQNLGICSRSNGGNVFKSVDQFELITFNPNSTTIVTTPVKYIDVSWWALSDASPLVTLNISELSIVPKNESGYVTICLDGAYLRQYTEMKPVLDTNEFKCNIMISVEGSIGTGVYMSKEQLLELESNGWDISLHSGDAVDTMTESELRALADRKISYLRNNGFKYRKGGRFICALHNIWSPLAVNILSEYFYLLREGNSPGLTNAFSATSLPVLNREKIGT